MFDDLSVLAALSLKQLLDHHHTLSHHSLCRDKTAKLGGHGISLSLQESNCRNKPFTISIGEQQHQAVEAGVRHLGDVGGAPPYSLNCGCSKRLILTLHIRLGKEKTL